MPVNSHIYWIVLLLLTDCRILTTDISVCVPAAAFRAVRVTKRESLHIGFEVLTDVSKEHVAYFFTAEE
jgi:hypothetical protein